MYQTTYTTLLISLIFLHLFSPTLSLTSFRSLESIDPHSSNPNIEIPIKAEEADYRFFTFSDPTLFYCEKTMDPLGVNDFCALQSSHFILAKPLIASNLSSVVYPVGNHIIFFGQNLMYIYSLQTNFERPRVQMMSALTLAPQGTTGKIDNVIFDDASQLIIAVQGTKAFFYRLNGSSLELKIDIDDPIVSSVDFKEKELYHFGNKYIVYFNRQESELSLYTVNDDKTLTLQNKIQKCQEIFVESQYVLAFAENKLKALDGKQELGAEFPYKVRAIVRSPPSGILVFAQDSDDNSGEEGTIFAIEFFEKKGFRLSPILTGPRDAQGLHLTTSNLYVLYDKWIRVYPAVKENEFSHEFYFDQILPNHVFGVAVASDRAFLVAKGKDQDIELYETSKSGFGLECKKEKGTTVVEYSFQVRCFSTKCDNPDFSTQKFSNGSCAYTRTMRISPEDEGGSLGIALLVTLGFVAGIAITIGLGVLHCFATKSDDPTKRPRSPKDKRAININKGLRRNNTGNNLENKKFLGEVDDSYTSEELRDQMLHSTKKKPQTLFETPRFVGAGGFGGHGSHGGHVSHMGYVNIDSKDQTQEMGDLIIGSGVQDEEGSGEVDVDVDVDIDKGVPEGEKEKKPAKVEIGKLKLDGKVFGKDLVSFRDVALQPIHEEKDVKEKKEGNGGKYNEFHDEAEEDIDQDNEEKNEGGGEEQGLGQENSL